MSIKDRSVTFKISQADLDKLDQSLRQLGYERRSPFLRDAFQVALQGGQVSPGFVNPRIVVDFTLQVRRLNSALRKALTLCSVSNDAENIKNLSNAVHNAEKLTRKILKSM